MPPDASKPADAGGVKVPPFADIAAHKLNALRNQGWAVVGYAIEREGKYGFVTAGAMVGWWLPEYYPDRHTDGSVDALQSLTTAQQTIERLTEALREHVTNTIWSAYNAGLVRADGMWIDAGMSDAEWLVGELGIEPPVPFQEVRDRLPGLVEPKVRAVLSGEETK